VSARLLATFCLGMCFVSARPAQSAGDADPELVVYLKTEANQPSSPLAQMKQEVSALMRTAGYRVSWRNPQTGAGDDAAFLAIVELNGICGLPAGYSVAGDPVGGGVSLATSAVSDGQVLPFSSVNCAILTRSVAPVLLKSAGAQRDYLYGRAMARVIAHELYHILTGSTDHARSGVARSCFSSDDLLAERFAFEGTTLARLKTRPEPAGSGLAVSEESTGR
jgi:hypothetical protein